MTLLSSSPTMGPPHAPAASAPRPGLHEFPTSYAQRRLWFIHRLEPESPTYNVPWFLRLTGALDRGALERSLDEIVRRHESLRTVFPMRDGEPVQQIHPPASVPVAVVDLSRVEERPRGEAACHLRERETIRAFDLEHGPLFRVCLVHLDERHHELLVSMHHIVSDGWSKTVLARELSALYQAFRQGRPSPLPEPRLQLADYTMWQRERLKGPGTDRELEYWSTRLADAPALDVPTDSVRSQAASWPGAIVRVSVSGAAVERLHRLRRTEGATPFMVLLAAFQWVLGRHARQDDIATGTVIASRRRRETEDLVGLLLNTLVIRTDLGGSPSFRELVRRTRALAIEAYANQDLPFEWIVQALAPARVLGRTPLFQSVFVVESGKRMPPELAGLEVDEVPPELERAKFELMMMLEETPEGLEGELQYASDLYDRESVECIVRHYERLLDAASADPDTPLSALALADAGDLAAIDAGNRTERAYPDDCGVHELVAAQAARTPEAAAVVHGSVRVPYGELERRANQLARYLQARGVGAETRVGLCVERGVDWVVGLLGILKAGGAYVPFDPSYPAERLTLMVEDARTALVLAGGPFDRPFRDTRAQTVCLDDVRETLGGLSGAPVESRTRGGDLAYVMYTSGSTGAPKGIMVPHRAIARLVRETDYVALGAGDRVAQVSNASFDAATFEVWGALANGAALVVIDKDVVLSPVDLARTLQRERATTMFLTAALFNQTAREVPGAFRGMREVLVGGEAVDPRWMREALADGPARLLNAYGPTETTTFAMWHEVTAVAPARQRIPIGRPIANTRVYVLDDWLRPVPAGMPGEICIGGPGVARGYWGRPRLTGERFVPDPFSVTGGARLYRTGDTGRRRPDGAIEYLGRADDQVKLRGYRIELGEIEAVLKQHEAVQDAVVVLRDEAGERQLAGYAVGRPGTGLRVAALAAWLQRRLPDYMVPAALVVLDRLPLTANGKVNRRELPAPTREDHHLGGYTAPRTELEAALCRIWAATLQVDRVGTTDNFFELGGHSLLAAQVMSRTTSELGLELPLRTLFEYPTVAAFAAEAGERAHGGAAGSPCIERVSRDAPLPVSAAQRRLWFLHQMQPASGAYNVPLFLRLSGGVDRGALERSLGAIVERHEVLRTSFPLRDGEPVQLVEPAQPVRVPLVDLSGLAPAARHQVAGALRDEEANRPFDLQRSPLRVRLVRLDDDEHELLLTLHHIATDGWSQGILVRELCELYAAQRTGTRAALRDPVVQYADYAAWQQRWLQSEAPARQMAYWRGQLDGVPALDMPTDGPRTQAASYPQASRPLRLGPELTAALKHVGRHEGATLFMALLAGFHWVLSRYARQDDVAVGTVVANRSRRDIEDVMGFFVNTLVLRVDVRGGPTFRDLLCRVREAALDAYANQDLPFERLVEELNPARDLARTPFFQALVVLQNAPVGAWDLPGLRVEDVDVELHEAKFELSLLLAEAEGGIDGRLSYAADLFEAETVDRLLGHYVRLLERAASQPDVPLAAIPLLEEDDRRRILVEWNRTAMASPTDGFVSEVIEAQVRRTPRAIAVEFEGSRLTYDELNARANRLARHLMARGLRGEMRVGVGLERGLDWAVAMLAVWKAGGVYVPLDLEYPKDRLAFMLEDAGAAMLLTDLATVEDLPRHASVVCLDEEWASIERQSAGDVAGVLERDSLAYVLYTSGSTGAPKGVMVEHGGLMNHLWAKVHDLGLQPSDVVAQIARASFDISIWQLLAPLVVGAQVRIVGDEISRDGTQQLAEIERLGVTVLQTVPSLLAVMVEQEEQSGAQRVGLGALRCMISNAEALPTTLCERWMRLYPGIRLLNTYGATECADDVTHHAVAPSARRSSPYAPLGTPLPNMTVYVLGDDMQPVPFGVVGELYIGGAGVSRGYLNRPRLTAARFVPDPFAGAPARRLYRTGDLVRLHRDRTLEFVGRTDFQVKLRGQRVELGEIAGALLAHAHVSQAIVLLREDVPGVQRIVAYVVGGGGADGEALPSELRTFLAARLPEHMVPGAFVVLDALPLTENGKVDRGALPPPGASGWADTYVPPHTEIEMALCDLWTQLLHVPRVGIHDNFFTLGGHSLLATQVVSRVRSTLRVEVPLAAVFRSPTVAAFAQELERARDAQQPGPIVAANRADFRSARVSR